MGLWLGPDHYISLCYHVTLEQVFVIKPLTLEAPDASIDANLAPRFRLRGSLLKSKSHHAVSQHLQ